MDRKPGLDLLRAMAILWVMPFHSYIAGYMGGGVLRWSGWMGVDLFFALSGFLIGSQVFNALVSRGSVDFVDFYLRRGFRTLPAYFVMLGIYIAWPSMREAAGMMPLWQFFTYTLNIFIDPNRGAFSHAWSLCVEEQFYLLFPLLALLLTRTRTQNGVWPVARAFRAVGRWPWRMDRVDLHRCGIRRRRGASLSGGASLSESARACAPHVGAAG